MNKKEKNVFNFYNSERGSYIRTDLPGNTESAGYR